MNSNAIAADADAFLSSEAAAGRFRGAVLVSLKSEVLLRAAYGLANEEWRLPNTPTTRFRIGSVTKTFTAAAVLQLAESGAVELDANIGAFLPDLPDPWQSLTIHQLLTHTAGLRDHIAAPAKRALNRTGARPADLIALIAADPLLFPPGTSRSYSNTGYILLGMLIEKASHRPYAAYLEEAIFRPLHLAATSYDSHLQILPERASGYSLQAGQLLHADFLDMTVPFAAGGLVSTVDDLLAWNTALHGGSLLTRASYQRMTGEYPESKKEDGFYGYGLFIARTSGYLCLSHTGGVNGFIAVLQYHPELHASLIVLSNLLNPLSMQTVVQHLSTLLLTPCARATIREFRPGDEVAFRQLNEEWITRFFRLEDKDRQALADPQSSILASGVRIFLADLDGQCVGCCSLLRSGPHEFELAKMAVSPSCQGGGIGRQLLHAAIAAARSDGARRLYLETNHILAPAIRLYESVGFQHLPPDRIKPSPYARSDVQMEMLLP